MIANKCVEKAEQTCRSYPNCYGCNAYKNPTNYDRIRHMSIDEMAKYFVSGKYPNFPSSPCYICEYDDGLCCTNEKGCTDKYKSEVYKNWLESEAEE